MTPVESGESGKERRRAVEALGQDLYEAEDPPGRSAPFACPTPIADAHVNAGMSPGLTEI